MKQIVPLFSSCVTVIQLDEDIKEFKTSDEKFKNSEWGSSSSSINKRVLEKYPKTKKILLDKFKKVALEDYKYENDFIITTSWFTKTLKDQSSLMHIHKNSFYSGVYYFDDYTDKSAPIIFHSPLHQFYDFDLMPSNWTIQNSTIWKIQPQKNCLLIFPSYLQHSIEKSIENTTRYSLAFNIIPVGEYGLGDSMVNTKWLI